MMSEIGFRRIRENEDGSIEEYEPVMRHGFFVMADRAVHPKHNYRLNQFYVEDAEAVAARLERCSGVSLRMRGKDTGQENLISANSIEILR